MDQQLQKEILKIYKSFNEIAFSGNTEVFLSLFDEDQLTIGTTEEEWLEGREVLKTHYEKIKGQIRGKVEFKNREIKVIPIDQLFLVVEKSDLFAKLTEEWVFVSKARFSTILRKKKGKWLIVHQHASLPDQHTMAGESLPYSKLKGEYDEMKEAVRKRTIELEESLANLKATQTQLIHAEKMASLGELTAGIAHEIQNPLNFVNNFSEVSQELLSEMKEELEQGDPEEALAIAEDVMLNLEKINHHGKRAEAIVKSMLQHSRSDTGKKEAIDINAIADEYLRLAYHGMRAKDKLFNVTMKTDFDQNIGNLQAVPQDIGRVILNLITNAFHAVSERKQREGAEYVPRVMVSTRKEAGKVIVEVRDNGDGIPARILDKVFQPFFTTKPTGQGTGLGLSLSREIVTSGHGGELKVATREGEGTSFTILLPM